ncbi:MAG TPA: cysteine synthase A [Victivallales bacterium]|nr:cysteine synthase A [Victivallales bacterium]
MKIYEDISKLTGRTPLVKINKSAANITANIFVKLEFYNPTSSIKDRIAVNMIDDAEKKGFLHSGGTIIEPTSGNTGLGLAMVAASRGYKLIITMPETMSIERQKLMRQLGAEIILTDGSLGMKGAITKAEDIHKEIDGSYMPQQFNNPSNPEIHYATTGPEIWSDTDGNVDIIISGIGTGGTLTGIGKYIKEKNPDVKLVAVEPETSAVLSGEKAGKHGIQGIGAGFIPEILDTDLIDEVIKVSDDKAIQGSKSLSINEGILAGISSGAAFSAALELAKKDENKSKNIVVILPDTGERYLSTNLFL